MHCQLVFAFTTTAFSVNVLPLPVFARHLLLNLQIRRRSCKYLHVNVAYSLYFINHLFQKLVVLMHCCPRWRCLRGHHLRSSAFFANVLPLPVFDRHFFLNLQRSIRPCKYVHVNVAHSLYFLLKATAHSAKPRVQKHSALRAHSAQAEYARRALCF